MTLLDNWDSFMAKYIRRTDNETGEQEETPMDLFDTDEWGKELDKFEPVIGQGKKAVKMTSSMCRKMALTSPFFCKGVWKKSMDSFRSGFTVNKEGTTPIGAQKVWIEGFNKRNNIDSFLQMAKVLISIYGFAPVYIRFAEDIEKKNIPHSTAPKKNAEPFKIYFLDPEKVKKLDYKNKQFQSQGIKHLVYKLSGNRNAYIHPDRFELLDEKSLPFSPFGISDVVILRHIISSNADIDIAMGKILKWFSFGTREWKKEGADRKDKEFMLKTMTEHPDVIASDKDYEFKIHTPEAIDPKPFYDYMTMAIAAVLVMPTHILTGVRVGRVTGAEAGYSDYHKDINDAQELIYAPFLVKMYQRIFTAHNTPDKKYIFDFNIEWNPSYVNEMAEAELLLKRALAVEKLMGKDHPPLLDVQEARKILERGAIDLRDDFKPKAVTKKISEMTNNYVNLNPSDAELTELKDKLMDARAREKNARNQD